MVPEFSEGAIQLVPEPTSHTFPLRPRIPSHLQIHAGNTTKVEIPYEPTVRVRGRVQTSYESQPVAGGLIYVSYGSFQQSEQVLTDADGRFEVNVLPGPVRQQLINRPDMSVSAATGSVLGGHYHLSPLLLYPPPKAGGI